MTSDETRIQILANWPMSHAKRVTRDNWKNPEYHVIAALRNLRTDTNCPAGKSWPNHVKNEQHIEYVSFSLWPCLVFFELKITNILKSSGWGLEHSALPWEQKFYSHGCVSFCTISLPRFNDLRCKLAKIALVMYLT